MREGPSIDENLNILFTCAGRRVALLEAFARALRELGAKGRIVAADATLACAACQKADVAIVSPPVNDADYLPSLLRAVEAHTIRLLVPMTDLDLLLLADNQQLFAEKGCTVMIGSPQIVAACRDKARTAELLAAAGAPSIPTMRLEAFERQPFYPCFAKPVSGSASVGARAIGSAEELAAHVKAFGRDLIVQELADGREYTIDVYRRRDGVVCAVVPRQRLAVRSGEVEKGVTANDPNLIAAAARLGESLDGLWGVFCCQCRCSGERDERGFENRPRFFEINPRFGGGAPLSIAAGADLPLYLLGELLGREVPPRVGQFQDNLLMLRYDAAAYVTVDDRTALPGWDHPQFR